jgi:hypothetical protein
VSFLFKPNTDEPNILESNKLDMMDVSQVSSLALTHIVHFSFETL